MKTEQELKDEYTSEVFGFVLLMIVFPPTTPFMVIMWILANRRVNKELAELNAEMKSVSFVGQAGSKNLFNQKA